MNIKRSSVLYVSHSSGINGAELCLYTLLKYLDRTRFIPIAVLPGHGALEKKLEDIGVKTYVLPLSWWIPSVRSVVNSYQPGTDIVERCNRLASLIQEEKVDLVHTNTSVVAEGAIAAKISGRPHIWHLHEILKSYPSLRPPLPLYLTYKFMDLHSDKIITVTNVLKEAVSGSISPEKISMIHNGLDVETELYSPRDLRSELGVPENHLLVCAIGSVTREKGYLTYIEAAKIILQHRKNVRFLIVGSIGDVELVSALVKDIRKNSLQKYIKFLGFRRDVNRILEATDIYVLPSQTESFGLTQLEAMAAAKPIVATRCGGPEEIVIQGETGMLVPVNNSELMAQAITSLVDDCTKRRGMGLKGRSRYERYFTPRRYCQQIEAVYAGLSGRRMLDVEQQKLADSLLELVIDIDRVRCTTGAHRASRWNVKRLMKLGYYQTVRAIAKQIPC